MSTTTQLTGDASTVKLWGQQDFIEMYKRSWFGHMISRNIAYLSDEVARAKAGDNITISFFNILKGQGKGEGETMKGFEEALSRSTFSMTWNTFRHAVSSPGETTIEQQRTYSDFEKIARDQLPRYHTARMDASFFNQLAGVYSTSITIDGTTYSGNARQFVAGLNTVTAPSTNRIIRAASAANDQSLTSADTFTLNLVDDALVLAESTYPHIEALDNDEFDLFCSPEQIRDLKRDSSSEIQWYANALAASQGGDSSMITEGTAYGRKPIAKYANVNIYGANRVATGEHSSTAAAISTVRRAVLCGRNAICVGSPWMTTNGKEVPLKYAVEMDDYEEYKGVQAKTMYGAKKLVGSDSEDNGSIVISTYGA